MASATEWLFRSVSFVIEGAFPHGVKRIDAFLSELIIVTAFFTHPVAVAVEMVEHYHRLIEDPEVCAWHHQMRGAASWQPSDRLSGKVSIW